MNDVSRPGKVLYPANGSFAAQDKGAVIAYYRDIAECLLPHVKDRFLTLHRFPNGICEDGFYQQSRQHYFPDSVRGVEAPRASGAGSVEHILIDDVEGLVFLADQGTLVLHGWQSRCDRPDRPDRLVFDLDPSDGDFVAVIDAARLLREVLELAGLEAFVMTTGSRGLHVVAPLERRMGFDAARDLAGQLSDAVVARAPRRFTRKQRKRARQGRLYLDIGRNAYGQTAVVPYSLRALPGAPVATPLDWIELGRRDLTPRRFRLDNIRRRLAQKADPWRNFFTRAARARPDAHGLHAWTEDSRCV